MKGIRILNLVLLLIAIVLSINLFNPNLTANLVSDVDEEGAVCSFYNQGKYSDLGKEQCCYQVMKQLTCEKNEDELFDVVCYVSDKSGKFFLLNQQMLNLCQKEGYDVGFTG